MINNCLLNKLPKVVFKHKSPPLKLSLKAWEKTNIYKNIFFIEIFYVIDYKILNINYYAIIFVF